MDKIVVDLLSLSPYVRFVQKFHANSTNYHVPWRILYDNEITFVTKGEFVVETESEKYTVKANEVHVMKPFVKHRYYVEEGKEFEYYCAHFDLIYDKENPDFDVTEKYLTQCWEQKPSAKIDEELVEQRKIYDQESVTSVKSLAISRYAEMNQLFKDLLIAFESDSVARPIRMKGIFLQILSEIYDQSSATGSEAYSSELVENYMNYIIENYDREIDLPQIVREYGISPSHFRKLFKNETNKAPHEFLVDYRIKQAKNLLLTHKYTVTEVAYMVGYDDYHYFSRLFTNKVGCSPKVFQMEGKGPKQTD